MRRRICFAATAVAAASLAVGAGMAAAAGGTPAKPTVLKCNISLTTEPPAGSNIVPQPPAQGLQYGPIRCRPGMFGTGIEGDTFTVPDSGDTVGKFTQYFASGTVSGRFDLSPQGGSGAISQTNFLSQTWIGTLKVTGGTGIYRGVKGLKGRKHIGTITCTSPDSVHLTCRERIAIATASILQ